MQGISSSEQEQAPNSKQRRSKRRAARRKVVCAALQRMLTHYRFNAGKDAYRFQRAWRIKHVVKQQVRLWLIRQRETAEVAAREAWAEEGSALHSIIFDDDPCAPDEDDDVPSVPSEAGARAASARADSSSMDTEGGAAVSYAAALAGSKRAADAPPQVRGGARASKGAAGPGPARSPVHNG